MRRRVCLLMAVVGCLLCTVRASASLEEYVKKPEPDFSWTKVGDSKLGPLRVVQVKFKSQTWRGIPWEHTLVTYLPQGMKYPNVGALYITGGDPGASDALTYGMIANRLQAPTSVLFNIPNQPLLGGKKEDDLIAHTFDQYVETGDETWPLLFPMVKSAVKAMDVLQEISKKEWEAPIEGFMVTGASKRGWTTYLTGATDPRVRAIAPMVFDNLNFTKQMPRQLELWGKYSAQIDDYTRRGLQQKMETERGKKLTSMVDPWFYRSRLNMPKLLIHGANDPYWSTDSTRLYWDDLTGDKYLLSVPNGGHGLNDLQRVFGTITAFFHSVASDRKLPQLTSSIEERDGKIRVTARSSAPAKEIRVWTAKALDLDFRPVKWEATPMTSAGDGHQLELDAPAGGGTAVFVEAQYEVEGQSFHLSAPARVFGKR